MTWLALRGADGIARRFGTTCLPDSLPRGTLTVELDLSQFAHKAAPVLRLRSGAEPTKIFTMERMADGRMHLLRSDGQHVSNLSIGLGREPVSGWLRLTYHWDTNCQRSLLTSENLTAGTIRQQEIPDAMPLCLEDVRSLFVSERGCQRHPAVGWFALGDHLQPVGPTPGLAGSTMIGTPDGPRPLNTLRAGDMVLTADNGPQPVIWRGGVSVPSMGAFRMIRLLAPYFGSSSDLLVQPSQRIAISGAEVEYLFGEDEVLVDARHLVNGQTAIWDEENTLVNCHGLLLATHELVQADGCWVDSLFIGRIAKNPDLARTTAPGSVVSARDLPIHTAPVRRELLEFEAQTLVLAHARSRAPFAA
ncbi:MAG: Hint domain-containing protein [Paracoccaceae bacterium]|nr:Hint domain-containing protein [Paracoccaceae bacterium]